ncbi:hypothetical protein C0Q70_15881 [Pomacea canaliculata]|uniref:Uncharacterized protein n=1 Tax=Pomacea canaliculata TaxID=400727 RepID=A0A2T7NW48_POMCA|nr:hypothetical protein C0Q70_15881 [Pomacea canaliculata]
MLCLSACPPVLVVLHVCSCNTHLNSARHYGTVRCKDSPPSSAGWTSLATRARNDIEILTQKVALTDVPEVLRIHVAFENDDFAACHISQI